MASSPDLTLREAAELAGVSKTAVEKEIEADVIRPLTHRAQVSRGATRYVPLQAVAYFAALKKAKLVDLPVRLKKALWKKFVRLEPTRLAPVEFWPGLVFNPDESGQRILPGCGALSGVQGRPYRIRCRDAWRHARNKGHANHRVFCIGAIERWRQHRRSCGRQSRRSAGSIRRRGNFCACTSLEESPFGAALAEHPAPKGMMPDASVY